MSGADLLVRGGRVFDGTGADPTAADVLVRDGVVAAVGPGLEAGDLPVRDATGLDVLPGLVDVHTHDDLAALTPDGCQPKLRQGVSSVVVGNCGHGPAPSAGGLLAGYSAPVLGAAPPQDRWATFAAYLDEVASAPRQVHVASLVPHGPLRAAVVGVERRPATRAEVDAMAGMLDEALTGGGAGLSLGLMYAPGNAAAADELRALAAVAARRGKLLVAHIRNEAGTLLDSLDEVGEIARDAGCGLHVSHLKVTGPRNFGRMGEALARLDALRADGVDVTADVYPYEAGSTTAATLFPSWATDGGLPSLLDALADPDRRKRIAADLAHPWDALENYFESLGPDAILLAGFTLDRHRAFDGRSLADIADELGADPREALIDLVAAEEGRLSVVLFQTDLDGMREALAWPWTVIGSDGLPAPTGYVHPRLYGTFPRVLTEYAGPGRPLAVAEAVHRMTGAAAHRFGLDGRGAIEPGAVADLVLVDPERLRDRASYQDPRRHPEGLEGVYLAGRPAWTPAHDAAAYGAVLRVERCGATLSRPSPDARR